MADRYPTGTNRRRFLVGVVFAFILYLISVAGRAFHVEEYKDLLYAIWAVLGMLFYYRFQPWLEQNESVVFRSRREQERKTDLIAIGSAVIPIFPFFFLRPEGLLLLTNLILIFLWLNIASAYLRGVLNRFALKSTVSAYSILFAGFIVVGSRILENDEIPSRIITILSSLLFAGVYYWLLDYKRFGNVFMKMLGICLVVWFLFLSVWGLDSYRHIAMGELLVSFFFIFWPAGFLHRSIRGFTESERKQSD